jgi:hypothetical protein
MAFTPEQQAQVDIQIAIDAARTAGQVEADAKRAKLEAVRLAKETLIENRRNLPVDQREVTAADITSFANTLVSYVNA